MTRIVNLYKEQFDIYIGRKGRGENGYFGNPINLVEDTLEGREKCLAEYKMYFYDRLRRDLEFKTKILDLEGKILGCFCHPKRCHGDIIIEWLEWRKSKVNQ